MSANLSGAAISTQTFQNSMLQTHNETALDLGLEPNLEQTAVRNEWTKRDELRCWHGEAP